MTTQKGGNLASCFAADAYTEQALREGLGDQEVRIQRGNARIALRNLAVEPPSRLVFVDLDGVSDPRETARQLTRVCAFQSSLVAIGSADSAQFSRELLQIGFADYLVKPISATTVRECSAVLMDVAAEYSHAGRVVTFVGNTGSGTSTLVAFVARELVATGLTATVIDLDPISSKLSHLLGADPGDGLETLLSPTEVEPAVTAETPSDRERVERICAPAAPGISLVAYGSAGPQMKRPEAAPLETMLTQLANRTHVVLVAGLRDPAIELGVMRRADSRVLVFEPTLLSISAAACRLAWLGEDYPALLVQSSTRMRRYGLSAAHIRYALAERSPDVIVPFEPALHDTSTGRSGRLPRRGYRKAIRQVAERVRAS